MDIGSLLGQYAFPIVACIAMAWYIKDQSAQNKEQIDKLSERHKEEMKDVTTAINNNTMAIQKLSDLIDRWERGHD